MTVWNTLVLSHITPYLNSKVGTTDMEMPVLQTNAQTWDWEKFHSN